MGRGYLIEPLQHQELSWYDLPYTYLFCFFGIFPFENYIFLFFYYFPFFGMPILLLLWQLSSQKEKVQAGHGGHHCTKDIILNRCLHRPIC